MDEAAKRLHSRKITDRLNAVRAVAKDPSPRAYELLLKAVSDKSGVVAAQAVRALEERLRSADDPAISQQQETAAQALIDRYWWCKTDGKKLDPGCFARQEIVRVLGEWEVYAASELFFDAVETVQVERVDFGLEDVAVALRARAAKALGVLGPPGTLLALSILLFDDDPRVDTMPQDRPYRTAEARKSAAQALAALGDPGGVGVLGARLAHPGQETPEVLVDCMDALASLDEEAALKVISPYLSGLDAYLAASAATALAGLSRPFHDIVLKRLSKACIERIDNARPAIAYAIASMRCDEAVEALYALAHHEDPMVAVDAIRALGQRGDTQSKEALCQFLEESCDPLIRMKVKEALNEL